MKVASFSRTSLPEFISKYLNCTDTTEEFGLTTSAYDWQSRCACGGIRSIEFKGCSIYKVKVKCFTIAPQIISFDQSKKYFVFNVDENETANFSILGIEKVLEKQHFVIYHQIDLKIEINQSTNGELIILELSDAYFNQSVFTSSLEEMMKPIFNQKSLPVAKYNIKVQQLLHEITETPKRGLCQLMFLNAKIIEVLSEITELFSKKETEITHQYSEQVLSVKQAIDNNLHVQYSIPDLAKSVGLNTSYLKKYFKDAYKETIFEYATRTRIEHAKQLLTTTKLPISTVAEKVGYQQSAHFTYAFKKNTGFTPGKFRQQQID
ncbi:helix-turn-helix domain-containing protein [Flammeovirga kamogawensis]|uniref:Helix-turn-helix transcriptional regulator n=1 Tax=Flammeovirga kamogawensis TaxID=373891 RepID=A0ABX8GPR5_9BACT|nr:AraC family transcriptional regulator [Flammeovirga kamogawensis]MBB6463470.1 AraC-like DNA-binding protein [Flammeovirga kamogawensis]QWG05604.1 helix-turn-helix transcriptional regulator [Flammeovirga kamogawensis]TRX67436.1 helix-turn-helix transcriptional regulator [Flammeovirga kamogawensis]